jgi:hypothetical protein
MRRTDLACVLALALTCGCRSARPGTPAEQWREIEARYPEFAQSYRSQQMLMIGSLSTVQRMASDTAMWRVSDTLTTAIGAVDWCRLFQRRGIVLVGGLQCSSLVDTAATRGSIRGCFNRFLRCENTEGAGDCDRGFAICAGTQPR